MMYIFGILFFPIKHEKKSPKKSLRRNLIDLLVFRGKVQKISHKKSCAKAINLYFVFFLRLVWRYCHWQITT